MAEVQSVRIMQDENIPEISKAQSSNHQRQLELARGATRKARQRPSDGRAANAGSELQGPQI